MPIATPMPATSAPEPYRLAVRAYGLRAPVDWGPDCEDQLRRMTALWNALVEIEQAHRAAYRALMSEDDMVARVASAFEALRAEKQALLDERKKRRRAARAKIAAPDIDVALAALQSRYAAALATLKAAKSAAKAQFKPRIAALEAARKDAVKAARQAAARDGLWWGNYNAVLADFQTARQNALSRGGELRFHGHDGSGRLVNQIIGGVPIETVFAGTHSQIAIAPANGAWRSARAKADPRCVTLSATVFARGRKERRNVAWPMVLHRPFPAGAVVQQVTISRRRCADRWIWQAVFTCRVPVVSEAPDRDAPRRAERAQREVGIDVGWRLMADGLRVACAVEADGTVFFLTLGRDHLRKYAHLAEMANDRDTFLNRALAELGALDWPRAPQALRASYAALRAAPRIAPRSLIRFIKEWKAAPDTFAPDALMQLEDWQREDRYIWRLHAGLAQRLARRRRDLYRNFAANIAMRFDLVAIEKLDLKTLKSRASDDGARIMEGAARHYAQIAASGDLLACIRHAAKRESRVLYEHAGPSTWTCHKCGHINAPPDRAALMQRCLCGALWDQDVNAAINLLAAARASGAAAHETPAPLESRFARAKPAQNPVEALS